MVFFYWIMNDKSWISFNSNCVLQWIILIVSLLNTRTTVIGMFLISGRTYIRKREHSYDSKVYWMSGSTKSRIEIRFRKIISMFHVYEWLLVVVIGKISGSCVMSKLFRFGWMILNCKVFPTSCLFVFFFVSKQTQSDT